MGVPLCPPRSLMGTVEKRRLRNVCADVSCARPPALSPHIGGLSVGMVTSEPLCSAHVDSVSLPGCLPLPHA